jgi:hypothetical protein
MAERSQNTYNPFTGGVSRNVAGMVMAVIKEYLINQYQIEQYYE